MKYAVILTLAIAFYLPVYAETLIFQTSTIGQQLNVENKTGEKINEGGYLIIDADLSNPASIVVNAAYYLHYTKKGLSKTQYTTILNPENMEMVLADSGRSKIMFIRWFDDPTGTYTVVSGTATLKDIGGLLRYTAGSASGNSVWREIDFRTGSGSLKLRLDIKATISRQGNPAANIAAEYENMLKAKGYNPE
jgi:hypothetical protein